MGEHKNKNPGEIKGQEYRKQQREPIRARWIKVEKIKPTDHKWARKHGMELKNKEEK